jgi:hypothetical protein
MIPKSGYRFSEKIMLKQSEMSARFRTAAVASRDEMKRPPS